MKQIRMVDLQGQYLKIKQEIDNAIQGVIDSTEFINGTAVKSFQSKLASYLDVPHVIPCANGTDALQVALMAAGLQPGDEVITTNFTFVATVEVIGLLGLKPVLVDICPGSFNIDPDLIEKAITPRTKAIIPVHLFGQCANMDRIMDIAEKHNLLVIEDTAQALGSRYFSSRGITSRAGTIGHIGTTSFFPSKNLGCFGDGGALFTRDEKLAHKMRTIVNHGSRVKYYHEELGVNSRLDTLQAAILDVKLQYLDQYNQTRQAAAAIYDRELGDITWITTPTREEKTDHIFHQYTLRIEGTGRDSFKSWLQQNNIPAMVYYPVGLSLQQAYAYLGHKPGDFPVTEKACREVISLPMHTELDEEQILFITRTIRNFTR